MVMSNLRLYCARTYSFIFYFILFCLTNNAYAHPFLWKVMGEHEFYIFGTIHLPDPRVTNLSDDIKQALSNSTKFYAELDLSEANTMMIKESMWLPDDKNLHNYLPADLQTEINKYLQSVNPELNLEFFSKQKIWVLAITLTVLEQQLKYPGHPPLDSVLYQHAVSLGLATGGLETIEEQLSVFDSMSIEDQVIFLRDTTEFMSTTKKNDIKFLDESITAYIEGDIDSLMDHLMSYMKDNVFYDELLDRLINQRNLSMVDKMLALVSDDSDNQYFFAVGAGHFWGDLGINTILMEKGYTIEAIE